MSDFKYGDTIGQYMVIKKLGEGTYGQTYLAKRDNTEFAIKYYKQSQTHMDEEKNILLAITTICKKWAACYKEDLIYNSKYFIVMDYINGVNLRTAINMISLNNRRNIDITSDIILGLTALHSLGLIHQDIKAENLIFTDDHHIKFIDFGISCLLNSSRFNTDTNLISGEPIFGLEFPCGTYGSLATTSPEMLEYQNDRFVVTTKGLPVGDKGIYPSLFLLTHDIWSIGAILLNWNAEPYVNLSCSIPPDTIASLEELNGTNNYIVIYSLLNRDIFQRSDNFGKLAIEYSSILSTNPLMHPPNLADFTVTFKQRELLHDWRCRVKGLIEQKYHTEIKTVCEMIDISVVNNSDIEDLHVSQLITVYELKAMIKNFTARRLYYANTELENNKTLQSYGIINGDVLIVH